MANFLNEYNNARDKKEVINNYNAKFVLNVLRAKTSEDLSKASADIQICNENYLNKLAD